MDTGDADGDVATAGPVTGFDRGHRAQSTRARGAGRLELSGGVVQASGETDVRNRSRLSGADRRSGVREPSIRRAADHDRRDGGRDAAVAGLIALDQLGFGSLRANQESLLQSIDFSEVLMQGMLSVLLLRRRCTSI